MHALIAMEHIGILAQLFCQCVKEKPLVYRNPHSLYDVHLCKLEQYIRTWDCSEIYCIYHRYADLI